MRTALVMALLLLVAAETCRADDPLESLNTVEETLSQLALHRATHSSAPTETLNQPQDAAAAPSGAVSGGALPVSPKSVPEPGEEGPSCCQDGTR